VRLWAHVIQAIRQITPEEAFGTNGFIGMSTDYRELIDTKLPVLINGLADLPQGMTLVLDDYHCIKESECHRLVSFFVEHLPEKVRLIFSTRHDLPLPLGRWRARDEVNEIRAEQLAFSEEETATLLKDRLGLDIDPGDLHALFERTEGWPAAIYLAALSLRGKKDIHAFIESFRGSNRFIFELLAEEILATLPDEEREFLLQSSILERLSASLCEAVTRTKNSGRLLRELEHSNSCAMSLTTPNPNSCPCSIRGRASGLSRRGSVRQRSTMPSKPTSSRGRAYWLRVTGSVTPLAARGLPWNAGSPRYPKISSALTRPSPW
jgi:LuxR family maltose regulon positive regulatory protein